MLTKEANERLTQTGPGTPMGSLLRRYWYPVATAKELDAEPVLPVRLLCENLVLYRNDAGQLGLLSERCPHRGASLTYGIPEDEGLRCPYHGWLFSPEGRCLEQPAEPASSTFHNRIRIPAYAAQEMGGLVWAYLGPSPAPLLPRYDLFVSQDYNRDIGITRLPMNWVQAMENSLDPVHLEFLHGALTNYVLKRQGKPAQAKVLRHERIAFNVFEHGIPKRRLLEGQSEDADDWVIGHPILFPNILAVGETRDPAFQIRVPVDDQNTLHYWYNASLRQPGEPPQADIPVWQNPYKHENGRLMVDTVNGQDMMAWVTQGAISDRTTERLGTTDKGVILYRSILMEQIERVERGEDPMAVVRDPDKNQIIRVPREQNAHYVIGGFIAADADISAGKMKDMLSASG